MAKIRIGIDPKAVIKLKYLKIHELYKYPIFSNLKGEDQHINEKKKIIKTIFSRFIKILSLFHIKGWVS